MDKIINEVTPYYSSKNITADFHIIIYHRIACHRKVLETSPYFKNLLNTPELVLPLVNSNELELPNEREDIFEFIVAYLYGCKLEFAYMSTEQTLLLLEKADFYLLNDLVEIIKKQISLVINYDNILMLNIYSELFKLRKFSEICLDFIETNITELISIDNFVQNLSKEQLVFICNELDLYIDEDNVLQLVEKWITFHMDLSEDAKREIRLNCIRLNRFTEEEFYNKFSGLLTIEDYKNNLQNEYERVRKKRVINNDFSQTNDVKFIGGQNSYKLLNKDNNYLKRQSDLPNGSNSDPIIIDLGQTCLINYIELHLFDGIDENIRVNYSFAYYVETSVNSEKGFYRVIDHSEYICRSIQKIYFYPREVRYIKIYGIASYVNLHLADNHIFLRSFSCRLTDEVFDISRGLWAPNMRITVSDMGCFLAEGENCPKGNINWMLMPGIQDTNYTFHKIGGGNLCKRHQKKALLVHLPQPIYINQTLTHLVEDCIYAIQGWSTHPNELTLNQININQAMLTFDHSLMLFLKIKGYYQNNDRFKCADFSNVGF